jgi:hypothetical protein
MIPGWKGSVFPFVSPPPPPDPGPLYLAVGQAFGATSALVNMDIGASHADRFVIATIGSIRTGGGTGSMTSLMIGGVAATLLASNTAATYDGTYIYGAAVPTGSTTTLVPTISSGGPNHFSVQLYRCVGLASTTPADTSGFGGGFVSLNIPNGGFALYVHERNNFGVKEPTIFGITGGGDIDYTTQRFATASSLGYVNRHASIMPAGGDPAFASDEDGTAGYAGHRHCGVAML